MSLSSKRIRYPVGHRPDPCDRPDPCEDKGTSQLLACASETQASKLISAVDLFCGVGGMTHGLQQAGIKVNAGIDIDRTCEYAYEQNNQAQFIEKDIHSVTKAELVELYPESDIKLLVGCAPCQPFSSHTYKNKNRNRDEKWGLLANMKKLIADVKPEIVSIENVTRIREQEVFIDFVAMLRLLNYHVYQEVVNCADYGIPQARRRLVLIASIFGEVSLLPKTHHDLYDKTSPITVRETIDGLEEITHGQVSKKDPLHRARELREINQKRIKQSKPGGTWLDWDADLRSPCHQKPSGQTYKSVYARMEWDKPAPTITTQFYNFGTGRFGHPEQDRALSLREGALLQTFPKDYDFINPNLPVSFTRLGIHIGNAIPVKLATVIGRSIRKHLEDISHG